MRVPVHHAPLRLQLFEVLDGLRNHHATSTAKYEARQMHRAVLFVGTMAPILIACEVRRTRLLIYMAKLMLMTSMVAFTTKRGNPKYVLISSLI